MTSVEEQAGRGSERDAGWARRVGAVLVMLLLYYAIQWLTGVLEVYPRLGLRDDLARHGTWVQLTDHHAWQMVLALVAIAMLGRGRFRAWGLNLHNLQESLRITRRFCYYYGVYFVGVGALLQIVVLGPAPPGHPWSAEHVMGWLAFGFLFVGVSEEILFRGLIHTFLARYWTGEWRAQDIVLPVAGMLAAVIFTVAHIGVRFVPFEIVRLSPPQLLQAFVLGLFYSWAYHRTRSLLAPILAHNFSNGALWLRDYVVFALLGPSGSDLDV